MQSANNNPRRVLFVIGSLAIGGAERHVVSVATGLRSRGWHCSVFAMSPKGALAQQLADRGIEVEGPILPESLANFLGKRLTAWTELSMAVFMLATRLVLQRRTIVHFFLPAAYIFGGLTAWITGARPRLMSRRSLNRYQLNHPIYAKIERRLHSRMDMLVGNSLAVVHELEGESCGRTPVRLIYNGIDESAMHDVMSRTNARAMLGIHEGQLVIAIVANLIPYKGHADLIESLAHVNQRLPVGWRLLCVGRDNGILKELRSLAESLGISSNIVWLGSRMDALSILSAADIAVSSSHQEGFSNAILEAMLAGLPLVVTDVGGNAEAVSDGVTGYVVPPHDPKALGDAILSMSSNPLRVEMGALGRARVLERFSTRACLDAYEALYSELP